MALHFRTCVLYALLLSVAGVARGDAWSLVVLPDTQHYSLNNGPGPAQSKRGQIGSFINQTNWAVANRDAENIRFVIHLGDIVERAGDERAWEGVDQAMSVLDGQIPYSILAGNHDFPDQKTWFGSSSFQRHFGATRYLGRGYSWYGGASQNNAAHYHIFEADGRQFLHINLEWGTGATTLPWAKRVLERHPGLPTIISTHAYLREDVDRDPNTGITPGYEQDHGGLIWLYLVNRFPQIFLVMNGHYHDERLPLQFQGEAHRVVQNAAGFDVYEILADYQTRQNGGDGWFRLMTFDNAENVIRVRTLNADGLPEEIDFNSRFDLPLPSFDDTARFPVCATWRLETAELTDPVDTYIRASQPTRAFGTSTVLQIFPANDVLSDTRRQALLKFPSLLNTLPPGAFVERAVLRLKTWLSGEGAQLHRMKQDWNNSATWNTFNTDGQGGIQVGGAEAAELPIDNFSGYPFGFAVDWDAQTGPASTWDEYTYVDVTESVIAWTDGAQPNYGWVLSAPIGFSGINGRPFWDIYGGKTLAQGNPTEFHSAESLFPGAAPRLFVTYRAGRFGDVNCDNSVDYTDIMAFVDALGGAFAGNCSAANADANRDGVVDFGDIDAFVALLNQTCP